MACREDELIETQESNNHGDETKSIVEEKRSSNHRTRCFDSSKSLRMFVAVAGVLMCAQSALSMYTKSVITSIEKRFQITSTEAGFIIGSFNIGNMIFVVWVSQFSSRRHRPNIMMIGSILIVIGGLINVTPHLAHHKPMKMENNTCPSSNLHYFLVVGEFIQGAGTTVLVPLSSSYIDDFAKTSDASLYTGIMFLLQNLGPGIGYVTGSFTSKLHVDFDKQGVHDTSDKEDGWIGAWWLGYLILSVWVLLSALPLSLFPKSIHRNELTEKHTESCSKIEMKTKTGIFFTLKRLLSNPVYMLVVCAYTGIMYRVGQLTAFMPKFLEVVFYQTPSNASLNFGLSMPFVICIGFLFGGILSKRFNWTIRHHMTFILLSAVITIGLCIPAYFITCDEEVSKQNCTVEECKTLEICKGKSIAFIVIISAAALASCNIIIPAYAVIMRSVKQEDKCTAIGLKFLIIRLFAFIPAPISTGAIIDDSCTEWKISSNKCALDIICQQYDREKFRLGYLNMLLMASIATALSTCIAYIYVARRTKSSITSVIKAYCIP